MPPPRSSRWLAALAATLVLAVSGCGKEHLLLPNQAPVVVLEKVVHQPGAEGGARLQLRWSGRDPDGTIDHYLFALDPESVARAGPGWIKTREVATSIAIRRRAMPTSGIAQDTDNGEPGIFAVCAVDAAGAVSAPATVAFFGSNIAPEVTIVDPMPGSLFGTITGTGVNIRWTGRDFDGVITRYKYRLFGARNPDVPSIPNFVTWAMANPDSFRRLYAPGFASWESVGPDVQSARYEGLVPGEAYLFAVTAFDNGGAYTPFGGGNLLRFHVTQEGPHFQPRIRVTTPLFEFESISGRDVDLSYELPFHGDIPVTWSAIPTPGSLIQDYRWVLDPLDPSDEKPRSHPTADPNHWTPWSLENTSTTIGPFRSARDLHSEHVLHIQARDIFNRVGTIRIHFTLVSPTSERQLLVVDDTRLTPDQVLGGVLQPPRGNWPTAAELDTFLYARGGFPWRGYPAGTVSTPGLLAGYDFDTLGTRGLADGIVPLSVLSRYRHVIWLTDQLGATFAGSPLDQWTPITSLRLMNRPGWMNTLAAYLREGGKLWLSGGGSGFASTAAWQRPLTPPDEFTNGHGELIPGRFMYDFTHWQSGFRTLGVSSSSLVFHHSSLLGPPAAPGRGWAGQPKYEKLLSAAPYLQLRTLATDPPPPLRSPDSFTYPRDYAAEVLFLPNVIVEDADSRPNHERLESTLDSLYVMSGPVAEPVMTYYHGSQGGSVVFSGFPVWSFQRTQAAAVTDFVLQDIWGLTRRTTALASRP